MIHAAGGAEHCKLLQISNADVIQILHVADKLLHLRRRVIPNDQNLLQFPQLHACLDVVLDNRSASNGKQGLRQIQR